MDPIIYVSEGIASDFSKKYNLSPVVTTKELVKTMKALGYKIILEFPGKGGKTIYKMERSKQ
jgi:hypothetical protein